MTRVDVIDRDFIDPIKDINLEIISDDEKYGTLRNALTIIKNTNIKILEKTNISFNKANSYLNAVYEKIDKIINIIKNFQEFQDYFENKTQKIDDQLTYKKVKLIPDKLFSFKSNLYQSFNNNLNILNNTKVTQKIMFNNNNNAENMTDHKLYDKTGIILTLETLLNKLEKVNNNGGKSRRRSRKNKRTRKSKKKARRSKKARKTRK